MNNWKKCKLGDIAEILNGYAFKSKDFLTGKMINSLPVVKIKNVANNSYALEEMQFCLYKEELGRYVINNKDILIALTGNHPEANTQVVGMVSRYKSEIKGLLNQRVAKITANDKADNVFLYYFLSFEETHNYIASFSSGSANQANISKTDLETIEILLPPLEEQRQIAAILSSIDDKIELLYKQNKTLEELAQTLFRHYFIENPNPSWQNVKIKELASITSGKSLKRLDMQDDGENPILGANGIIGFTNKYLYDEPLLYTGRVGTLGKVFMINSAKKVWLSDNTLIIKPSSNFYFMYFVLKTSNLENLDIGSTQPLIRQSDLGEIEILLADDLLLEKFDITAKKIFDKIDKNLEQIQTLENMRDILIPKLLNGEIKINN
ncbi:restriction endonuclease subunit S [Campylobacter lari]|nr:restriction endonuclease subunit S [Campylobacter lari]